MSTTHKKERRKKLVSFTDTELQKITAACNQTGISASELIRIGAWLLASKSPSDLLTLKLKYVRAAA